MMLSQKCLCWTYSGTKGIFVSGCLWFFSMKQSQTKMIYISTSAEGHVRPQRNLYVPSFPLVLYHLSHMFSSVKKSEWDAVILSIEGIYIVLSHKEGRETACCTPVQSVITIYVTMFIRWMLCHLSAESFN